MIVLHLSLDEAAALVEILGHAVFGPGDVLADVATHLEEAVEVETQLEGD